MKQGVTHALAAEYVDMKLAIEQAQVLVARLMRLLEEQGGVEYDLASQAWMLLERPTQGLRKKTDELAQKDIAAAQVLEEVAVPEQVEGYKLTLTEIRAMPRRKGVLLLVAEGMTNKQIAEALVLSPETVKSHLFAVNRDLGTKGGTRAFLVAEARRQGLI